MPVEIPEEIIDKAQSGDRNAFRLLVERHQAFVYSLSYRFVGNRDDAEDLTQEVFIRLWKNLSKYRKEIRLSTWLYRITTNACLDHLRSRQWRKGRLQEEVRESSALASSAAADENLLNQELVAAIAKMAEMLTPKQRAAFILRDMENLDVAEVCEILSISPEKLKGNLYYARQRIAELLRNYYDERKRI